MRVKSIFFWVAILVLGATGALGQARGHAALFSSKSLFSRNATSFSRVNPAHDSAQGRLARVTAYWPGEDYFTTRKLSATGVRLRKGICAVDSSIIPYGSVVQILGVGSYVAMDTGSAVISRRAARMSGASAAERGALVIDLYFPNRRAGELFSREGPKFALVAWQAAGASE